MSLNFLFKFFILIFIISNFTQTANANIYELTCKNKKNTTTWVFSNKRKQVVLSKVNSAKTKVNFKMDRQTPGSFSSKGSFAGYETNVTYTKKTNELAILQKALRGSNQFYKCSEPKLIKEE